MDSIFEGHSFQGHSSSTLQRGSGGSYHSVQYKLIHQGVDHYSGGDWASLGLARVEQGGLSTAATHSTWSLACGLAEMTIADVGKQQSDTKYMNSKSLS